MWKSVAYINVITQITRYEKIDIIKNIMES